MQSIKRIQLNSKLPVKDQTGLKKRRVVNVFQKWLVDYLEIKVVLLIIEK